MKKNSRNFFKILMKFLQESPLFSSIEIIISLIIATFATYIVGINFHLPKEISVLLFPASATIMGIVIAGFAVFSTLTDPRFNKFVQDLGVLPQISFPFWINAALWMLSLLTNGLLFLFSFTNFYIPILILSFFGVLTFCLSLSFTVSVVGLIYHVSLKKGEFDSIYSSLVQNELNPDEERHTDNVV